MATYVYEWARFRPIYLWSRIYSLLYSLGICVHQKVGFSLIKAQKMGSRSLSKKEKKKKKMGSRQVPGSTKKSVMTFFFRTKIISILYYIY